MAELKQYTPDGEMIFSVAELNLEAAKTLDQHFGECLVQGEISELKQYRSGHMYFTLKDERASIRCVLFRGKQFGLAFLPQDGDHVLIRARLSIYPERGDFQIIVNHIELAGEGDLQQQFLALKDKLDKAGLFDSELKRTLPAYPKHLGIITSPDAAALQDILNVLKRRFPALPITVYASLVQGAEAPNQLIKAIQQANHDKTCDVLILARGGGSIEDLWAFNNEQLAYAIYDSQIPIVSGVGHETDITIADWVADVRAPTPSAAAELISPDQNALLQRIQTLMQQAERILSYQLTKQKHRFSTLQQGLNQQHPRRQLQFKAQHLDNLTQRLFLCSPAKKVSIYNESIAAHGEILSKVIHRQLQTHKMQLAALADKLNLVSPLNTLSRGYAIAEYQGNILKSIESVDLHDDITITLQDGTLTCQVMQKIKKTQI